MTEAATIDLTKVVAALVNIRDARATRKAEWEKGDEELKTSQERLEAVLLGHLNDRGLESVRTEFGTFYRQVDVKPSCSDWDALNKWVAEHDAWDIYERRLKKTFVSQFMEAHDGTLPPGVNAHRAYVVRVRRA